MAQPPPQQNPETFSIIVRYIGQRLERERFEWVDQPAERVVDGQPRPFTDANADVHATMLRMTTEFERRYVEAFQELGGQLEFDRESAYQTFQGLIGATFQEGVSWGKIVALVCLSGALASKCVSLNMPELGELQFRKNVCDAQKIKFQFPYLFIFRIFHVTSNHLNIGGRLFLSISPHSITSQKKPKKQPKNQ